MFIGLGHVMLQVSSVIGCLIYSTFDIVHACHSWVVLSWLQGYKIKKDIVGNAFIIVIVNERVRRGV